MFSDYSIAYHGGKALIGGKFQPAGTVACMALNLSKEDISRLDRIYREQKQTGEEQELRDGLYALDCVAAVTDLLPDDASSVLDEIICFRVYIRHFLTKYHPEEGCSAAWEAFLDDLDGIAAQLQRIDNLTRTVLHPDFDDISISYREKGGELCEIVQTGFGRLLLFDLMQAMDNERPPKRCPCCGGWFVPTRSNEVYCGNIAPDSDGRTCRELGAGRAFSQKASENKPMQLCRSACSRIYTRKNRGKLTAEEAAELTAKCRELRDLVLAGKMTAEEMEEKINELVQ